MEGGDVVVRVYIMREEYIRRKYMEKFITYVPIENT